IAAAPATAPSDLPPRLQGVTDNPSALLTNGLAQLPRKEFADGDRIVDWKPGAIFGGPEERFDGEGIPQIAASESHRQVVVFGQRREAERLAVVARGGPLEGCGSEAGAGSRPRARACEP